MWNIHIDLDKEYKGSDRWEEPIDRSEDTYPKLKVVFKDRERYATFMLRVSLKWHRYDTIEEYVREWLLSDIEFSYTKNAPHRHLIRVRIIDEDMVALGTGEKVPVIYREYRRGGKWPAWSALAYWATDVGTIYERWYWVWISNRPANFHRKGVKRLDEIVPYILSRITPANGSTMFGVEPAGGDAIAH